MIFQTEENSSSLQKEYSNSPIQSQVLQSVNERQGYWQQNQSFKFVSYLIYNRQSLKLKLQRRTSKVFKQMAQFIGTRNAIQCRSQNQRLFRKHHNFRCIVSSFKSKYGRERFEKDYESVISNPEIRFKTDLQYYLNQKIKKSREIACQTEPNQPQLYFYCLYQPQFVNNFMQNVSPLCMALPFQI